MADDLNTILQAIRDKLARNAALKSWCTTTYGNIHRIAVGNDGQVPLTAAFYPLVMLAPASQNMGEDVAGLIKGFGLTCGVYREHADAYPVDFPGLVEGTNAATLKITSAFDYLIAGTSYTKAATDNIAMTACAQQAASRYAYYLVSIGTTGTVTVTKGADSTTEDGAAVPSLPANSAPVGTFLIATDGSHTFTSGTTDLSGAGITVTFQDWNIIELKGVQEVETFRTKVVDALKALGEATLGGRLKHIEASYEVIDLYPFFLAGMEVQIETDYYQGSDTFV